MNVTITDDFKAPEPCKETVHPHRIPGVCRCGRDVHICWGTTAFDAAMKAFSNVMEQHDDRLIFEALNK